MGCKQGKEHKEDQWKKAKILFPREHLPALRRLGHWPKFGILPASKALIPPSSGVP